MIIYVLVFKYICICKSIYAHKEIMGSNPVLAFKFQRRGMFLPCSVM